MESYIVTIMDVRNKKTITLPMTPRNISKSGSVVEKSFETVVSGEITRPKGRTVQQYSFTGLIPDVGYDIPTYSDISPFEFEELIEDWIEGRPAYNKELRLIVADTTINTASYIKDYSFDYSGGGRMIRFNIDFVEWRKFNIKVYDAKKTSSKTSRPTKPTPKTYVIVKNDNLSKIARKFSGKSTKWPELYSLNKSNLRGKTAHEIYPGEKLTIPPGWSK